MQTLFISNNVVHITTTVHYSGIAHMNSWWLPNKNVEGFTSQIYAFIICTPYKV
jgi:hypothetical protein